MGRLGAGSSWWAARSSACRSCSSGPVKASGTWNRSGRRRSRSGCYGSEMSGAQILIVEDHPTMREAMRMVLEHEGFPIREAADGAAALEMVREQQPDLVFLDLNIPGTSGSEVLRELKGNPETSDVRVIIVTATGEEGR